MQRYLTIMFLMILIVGCSKKEPAEQKPGAKYVVLTTTEPDPRVCVYLGDTEAQAKSGDLGKAQIEAREKIKNKAVELKGNTVMLDTTLWDNPGVIASGEVVLTGRIFRCDFPKDQIDPLKESGAADDRRRRSGDTSQQELFDSVQSRAPATGSRPETNNNNQNFPVNQGNNQNNQGQNFQTNQGNTQGQNFQFNQGNNQNNQGNSQYYQGQNLPDNRGANQNNQEPDLFEDTRAR